MTSFWEPERSSMAPPCFLCTRISVMSFHWKEREYQRTLFVMPVWFVVTEPLASQRASITNVTEMAISTHSGRCISCHDHIDKTIAKTPPARPTARHCRLIPYMLVPSRVLGSWAPFAPNSQRVAITISATIATCKMKLAEFCMVNTGTTPNATSVRMLFLLLLWLLLLLLWLLLLLLWLLLLLVALIMIAFAGTLADIN